MKSIKTFLKNLAAVALAAVVMAGPTPAFAQGVNVNGLQVQPFSATFIGNSISAVSTDVALYVKYTGSTSQTATLDVAAADSDFTFQVAGANDATINVQSGGLPACGASVGVLDTADADCNTLGELIDHINASANWSAVIVAGLRTDATANTLLTLGASARVKDPGGVEIFWETPQALAINVALIPVDNGGASLGIQNWLARSNTGRDSGKLATRPFPDRDSTLLYYSEKVTTTGAVGNIIVYCVIENYIEDKQASSSEQANILYLEAGAATTVTGKVDEFTTAGGLVCNGGKLFVRVSATTDLTAPTVVLTGFQRFRRVQ